MIYFDAYSTVKRYPDGWDGVIAGLACCLLIPIFIPSLLGITLEIINLTKKERIICFVYIMITILLGDFITFALINNLSHFTWSFCLIIIALMLVSFILFILITKFIKN